MWELTLYTGRAHEEIAAHWRFPRMKDAARVLAVKPTQLSNTYHRLIQPRGILAYCTIEKSTRARRATRGRLLKPRA